MLSRTCGAMDNASAYGAEDSRFESWQVRNLLLSRSIFFEIINKPINELYFVRYGDHIPVVGYPFRR